MFVILQTLPRQILGIVPTYRQSRTDVESTAGRCYNYTAQPKSGSFACEILHRFHPAGRKKYGRHTCWL